MPLADISFLASSMAVSAAGIAAPETLIKKAMPGARNAAIGITQPAWLHPSSPM